MKYKVWLVMILVGWLLFSQVGTAEAAVFRHEELAVVKADEVVNDTLFATGETVRIEGIVNGDVFVGGGMVRISGTVNGDVWAGGGMVEITGTVRDDVMIGGGNVSLRGAQVGDDVNIGGGNVNLDDQTKIGGGLVFGSGSMVSEATVGKSVVGGGGSVTFDGPITEGVTVGAGQLYLGSRAKVGGDVTYSAEEPLTQDPQASVSGQLKQFFLESDEKGVEDGEEDWQQTWWGFQMWSWLSALVIGGLLLWLAPWWLQDAGMIVRERSAAALGWGALVSVLVLPVFLVLLVTVIGIPLALILLVTVLIELYLAKIVVGMVVGNWLAERMGWANMSLGVRFVVGLTIYYMLVSLPFVGWLVWLVGTLMGLGAMKLWKWEWIKRAKQVKK